MFDANGVVHALQGSKGCSYVHESGLYNSTVKLVPLDCANCGAKRLLI